MAILLQGLILLLAGMGIVYAFLALLVFIMNCAAVIVPRFNHILPDDAPKKKPRPLPIATPDHSLIAVVVAAAKSQAAQI